MTALAVLSQNKFHLSLNVSNLDRAIGFYRILFDRGPLNTIRIMRNLRSTNRQ